MSEADDLALGRKYMASKYEAGFSGINWPVEVGGQGLSPLHKVAFDTEEMRYALPTGYFGISIGMPVPVLIKFGEDRGWVRERVIAALRGEGNLVPALFRACSRVGSRRPAHPRGARG